MRYDWLELTLLHFVKGIDPKALLAPDETAVARASALQELQSIEGDIGQKQSQADVLTDELSREQDRRLRDAIKGKLNTVLAEIEALQKQRAEALTGQTQANGSDAISEQIRSVEQLVEQMAKLKGEVGQSFACGSTPSFGSSTSP